MGIPLKGTLTDLRSELRARCGFVNQGPATLLDVQLYDSFLTRAQQQVWHALRYEERRLTTDFSTAVGQTVYDIPDNVAITHLTQFRVLYETVWIKLLPGIEYTHDTYTADAEQFPIRYDFTNGQIELWPEPDAIYTVRIEHYPRPARFTQNSDRVSMDEDLVFHLALYNAKLHYRQPDAEASIGAFNAILADIKAAQHTDRRYVRLGKTAKRRSGVDRPDFPRPQMV